MPDLVALLQTRRRTVLLVEIAVILGLVAWIWIARSGQPDSVPPVVVTMSEMLYQPRRIVVRGPEVTLELRNAGSLEHDFSIDALRLSPNVRPGQSETVTFSAAPGSYEVYCSIRGHRQAGMVAELVVEG